MQICVYEPVKAQGLPGNIVSLSAGEAHSLALGSDGQLWGSGDNSFLQLGADCPGGGGGCFKFTIIEPVRNQRIDSITCGAFWTLATRASLVPPVFSPPPGIYGDVAITLSHPDPTVAIRFTLNEAGPGADPDEASRPWSSFVMLSGAKTVTIKAYAECTGCGKGISPLVTAVYNLINTAKVIICRQLHVHRMHVKGCGV